MAQTQVINYAGKTFPLDTANTASAGVVRDTDGSINVAAVNAPQTKEVVSAAKTGAFTADATATVYPVDCTSAGFTGTLPPAATATNRAYEFVKTNSANTFTLDGDGSETISGSATKTLTTQWSSIRVISDGSNWLQI
jgi:hypothetical protein